MSAVRNARKKGVSKPVRRPIRERGRLRSGEKPGMSSCSPTQNAGHAELRAKFLITPIEMSTEYLHILTYRGHSPSAPPVISVFITVDSSALNVAKLERNKKVEFAIGALAQTIRNELYLIESTKTENAMPITKSRDDGRESGKRSGV